jgi:hypothetical protein
MGAAWDDELTYRVLGGGGDRSSARNGGVILPQAR